MSEDVDAVVERVEGDAPCRQCGYNLRGMAVAGNCPECGGAVEHSIHGDLLQFSSVAWLERVRLGFTLMLWGIVVHLAGGFAGLVVLRFVLRGNEVVSQAWALGSGVVSLVGVWLMTEPDPAERFAQGKATGWNSRRVARLGLIGVVCLSAARIGTTVATVGNAAVIIDRLVYAVQQVVSLIGTLAELTYMGRLAGRIPKMDLANRAKQLRTAYGIIAGLMVALITLMQWVLTGPTRAMADVLEVLGCFLLVVGVGVLVIAIMEIVLIVRMRRALNVPLYVARGNQGVAGATESISDTPSP